MRNPFGSSTSLLKDLKDNINIKGPITTKKPKSNAESVEPGLTYWIRPPEGMEMEDGTQMGEKGYVDPHAGTMAEWEDIDKGSTGGFRPDGTTIMHSDADSAATANAALELNQANQSAIAGTSNSSTGEGGYGKKRKGDQTRKQMNLTGSRGSSILTS